MEQYDHSSAANARSSSETCSSRWRTSPSSPAVDSTLQHKPSLATTRSSSSASVSVFCSSHAEASSASASAASPPPVSLASTRSSRQPAYSETLKSPKSRSFEKPKRLPVYIRIVPKDIWLRIHVDPSQTIGSIKDTALFKANAPDHDASLSYRFYQDAINASVHAKIAPVAAHDKVIKHRTYALPRSFVCPPPDLTDIPACVAASIAGIGRANKSRSHGDQSLRSAGNSVSPPGVPPLPTFDTAYSPCQAQSSLRAASVSPYASQHKPTPSSSPRSHTIPLAFSPHALNRRTPSAKSASSGDGVSACTALITRQISNSTLATSPPSTWSDGGRASNIAMVSSDASASDTSHSQSVSAWNVLNDISICLDASLITGNRNAKLEEDVARSRLLQWNARYASTGSTKPRKQSETYASMVQWDSHARCKSSSAQSYSATPTMRSSSTFDREPVRSRNELAASPRSSVDASSADSHVQRGSAAWGHTQSENTPASAVVTPPKRLARLNAATIRSVAAAPAIFYTQPGACESSSSLASFTSLSSSAVGLMTTQDDDASVMQWGTQAERAPFSDSQSSPSPTASHAAAFAPLSSPLQPSEALLSGSASSASSPLRPRSKTVTAADVVRSRPTNVQVPPMMSEAISSPVCNASLPKSAIKKMQAETSQRRYGQQSDLLDLLKGTPARLVHHDDNDDADHADHDEGFATVKQRSMPRAVPAPLVLRKASSRDSAGASSPPASSGAAEMRDDYIAGIRIDKISRGCKDASHPLSSKYAVLSSANGCELEEWQTVAAYKLRPYELLEMQWSIPTERVYIAPINLQDVMRVAGAASSVHQGALKQTCADDTYAGPDADALCLEPYFEGWVYVMKGSAIGKSEKPAKGSAKPAKWKLHWMMVKGWRIDLYRKKPRAGEAVLPVAEQVWSLRSVQCVVDAHNAVPASVALPALDIMPTSSLTVAFSTKGGTAASTSNEMSRLTLRCITQFDHQVLSMLLHRAWYRCSASSALVMARIDDWRRKAVFRAIVAGRGGTVALGRAGRGGRNAASRTRLRPSGWPKEWEDADQWSSDSEREQIVAPAELENSIVTQQQQARRETVTQAKANQRVQHKSKHEAHEAQESEIVPNGLYAALLGRSGIAPTRASKMGRGGASESLSYRRSGVQQRGLAQSASLPHMEPGLMLGSTGHYASRRRSGSATRSPARITSSPEPAAAVAARSAAATRGRSTSSHSSRSSRDVSRSASPMPWRKTSASGGSTNSDAYAMSPASVPGLVDVQPRASVMVDKFKPSQQKVKDAQASSPS